MFLQVPIAMQWKNNTSSAVSHSVSCLWLGLGLKLGLGTGVATAVRECNPRLVKWGGTM